MEPAAKITSAVSSEYSSTTAKFIDAFASNTSHGMTEAPAQSASPAKQHGLEEIFDMPLTAPTKYEGHHENVPMLSAGVGEAYQQVYCAEPTEIDGSRAGNNESDTSHVSANIYWTPLE